LLFIIYYYFLFLIYYYLFLKVYGGEEFDDENFPENPHETKKERKERLGKEKREKDLADKKEKEREAKEKKERESNEKKEKGRLIKEKKEKEKEERMKLGKICALLMATMLSVSPSISQFAFPYSLHLILRLSLLLPVPLSAQEVKEKKEASELKAKSVDISRWGSHARYQTTLYCTGQAALQVAQNTTLAALPLPALCTRTAHTVLHCIIPH
jgi:hypothetical protein